MTTGVLRADALTLPIADASVDLIVTSPPYFALRSYQDDGEHYGGQIGSEPTPDDFLQALWAVTKECWRVLKPSGSLWVNLGDSYAGSGGYNNSSIGAGGRGPSSYKARKWGTSKDGRRHHWTRQDAAWLAGVIDCDGSISVHQNKTPEGRSPSFVGWVRIGQMDREVVDRVAWLTGVGHVFQDKRGVWNWHASSQMGAWVLQRIWPWLVIKQRQALAVIELCRHVDERNARGTWSPLTRADTDYRATIKDAVQAWNKRAAFDWTPPRAEPVQLPYYEAGPRAKSLHGLPWRYAIGCVDGMADPDGIGWILRAEVVWSKPNGLPESVTDRVRRSHEQWFHLTKQGRYYSAVDEIREAHVVVPHAPGNQRINPDRNDVGRADRVRAVFGDASLGKLPGSVWSIPSEPLLVPESVGVDHFAAFPQEWPRRLILGWSPREICTACGEGRRPVTDVEYRVTGNRQTNKRVTGVAGLMGQESTTRPGGPGSRLGDADKLSTITGYACACTPHVDHDSTGKSPIPSGTTTAGKHRQPSWSQFAEGERGGRVGPWREYDLANWTPPPSRPAVVLDPFGGTGTVAMVAQALGRIGISVDLSADYCRLAQWRINESDHDLKAIRRTDGAAVAESTRDRRTRIRAGHLEMFDEAAP